MTTVHLISGITLLLANAVAAGWGGYAWIRQWPSVGFWYALRFAQITVVIQLVLGFSLVVTGHRAADLHYLYGALPLVVSLLAELARIGAAGQELGGLEFRSLSEQGQHEVGLAIVRREMGIMAVGCMVIFFLALRAAGTTPAL